MKPWQPSPFVAGLLALILVSLASIRATAQEVDVNERQEALLDSPEAEVRQRAIYWMTNGQTDLATNLERRVRIAAKLNRMATEDPDRDVRFAALRGVGNLHERLLAVQREEMVAAARAGNRNAAELLMTDEYDFPIPEIMAAVEPQTVTKDELSSQFTLLLRSASPRALGRHLKHEDARIRLALAEALTDQLRERVYAKTLVVDLLADSDPAVRRCAMRAAVEHNCDWQQDLDRVHALVHDADEVIASMAMNALTVKPNRFVMLGEWLQDEKASVRTSAVQQLNDEHAGSLLARKVVLNGIDGSVESMPYIEAAVRLSLVGGLPRLADIAFNVDADCRVTAIDAIATFGRKACDVSAKLQVCLRLTNDPRLRESLAIALGTMGPDAAHAAWDLEAAIDNTEPMTAIKILEALAVIDPSAQRFAWILERYRQLILTDTEDGERANSGISWKHPYRGHVADSLQRLGVRAAPLASFIAEQLISADPKLKAKDAIDVLEAMQVWDAVACERLMQYVLNPQQDLELRCRALQLLSRSDQLSDATKQSLLKLFDAEEEGIRISAMRAAPGAGLESDVAVPKLVAIIDGRNNESLTAGALDSLIGYGPRGSDAAEAVATAMLKRQWGKHRSLQALLAMGPGAQAAVPTVVRLLEKSNDEDIIEALDFLGAMSPTSPEALAALQRQEGGSRHRRTETERLLALIARHAEVQLQFTNQRTEEELSPSQ